MRFGKLRLRNMGCFRGEHEFDIGGSVGPIVGVTGENGAGKSTMLGLLLGAIYRECPTRGSLLDLATARDSFVEVEVSNGKTYKFRQLCDAVSKKSETLITDSEGRPLVESGKVTEAKAFVAKHFPSLDLVLNSTFGAQKSAGFVGMKPAERKSLVLQLLGVERLERFAEGARERVKAHKARIETLEARMVDERARQSDDAPAALERAIDRRTLCEQELLAARAELEAAEAESLRHAESEREASSARLALSQVETAIQSTRATVADIETRLANCRAEVADAERIRAAITDLAALDTELVSQRAELARQSTVFASLNAEHRSEREKLTAAQREKREAEQRFLRLKERLAEEGKVARALATLPQLRHAAGHALAVAQTAELALDALRAQRLTGADERIAGLRNGLSMICEGADERAGVSIASDTLDTDDAAVKLATELPAQQRAAEGTLRDAKVALLTAERELAEAERTAARAAEFEAVRADLELARRAIDEASERETLADLKESTARKETEPLAAALDALRGLIAANELNRVPLSALAARVERLAKAETMLVEREQQLSLARSDLARFEADLAAMSELAAPTKAPDVASFRAPVLALETQLRGAEAAVAVAQQRSADTDASAARLAVLKAERAGLDDELADWTRLAADLGRDGLQAMVIDAAIPELNHTANELLRSAFGPRFTIDVRTQASDAKGRRLLETLDVVVLDSELGREALAETLSGGELVIVSEALSLALTVLACRQAGVERPTIIRDESGAALSEGKAAQWIAMLRRAADLIGCDRILFVSHTPATWDLADSVIHLASREAA